MVRFVNSKTESVDLFKPIDTLITPVQINLSQNSNILYRVLPFNTSDFYYTFYTTLQTSRQKDANPGSFDHFA